MSLVVAVVGAHGLGVATDSILAEEGPGGQWALHTGEEKVVRRGDRIAAVCGALRVEGRPVLPLLAQALEEAERLKDVPDHFQRLAGPVVRKIVEHYRTVTAGRHDPGAALRLFYAERLDAATVQAFAAEIDENTAGEGPFIDMEVHPMYDEAHVVFLGSVDEETFSHSTLQRTLYRNRLIVGRGPLLDPPPPTVPAGLGADELEAVARDLVDQAIGREPLIPRAPWAPPGLPLIAGPSFGYRL